MILFLAIWLHSELGEPQLLGDDAARSQVLILSMFHRQGATNMGCSQYVILVL